jgi:hypothetical protein
MLKLSPRARAEVALLLLINALSACGGSDPIVTVWAGLPTHNYVSAGELVYTSFPEAQASVHAQARLNDAGVATTNRRCTNDSGLFGGRRVSFVDGIAPRYVLFDIAESDVARARAAGYQAYTKDLDFLTVPFWDCALEGY